MASSDVTIEKNYREVLRKFYLSCIGQRCDNLFGSMNKDKLIEEIKNLSVKFGKLSQKTKCDFFRQLITEKPPSPRTVPGRKYRKGYISKYNSKEIHERKKIKGDMERKLHYQSCYVYFFLKSKGIHPNEVQMMCAERNGHQWLFFLAVNNRKKDQEGKHSIAKVKEALLVNQKNAVKVKLDDHEKEIVSESKKGGEKKNMEARIKAALKTVPLDLGKMEFVGDGGQIDRRHAEEFLCDKAVELGSLNKKTCKYPVSTATSSRRRIFVILLRR